MALLDGENRAALRLPRVVVSLSPRSLHWGFEQLYIASPDLDIRRAADGRIFVAGLPISQGTGDSSAATDWLFSQGEVVIREGTVRWNDEMRGAPSCRCRRWMWCCATATGATACAWTPRPRGLGRPLHAGGHVPRAAAAGA